MQPGSDFGHFSPVSKKIFDKKSWKSRQKIQGPVLLDFCFFVSRKEFMQKAPVARSTQPECLYRPYL
jgi:hypothetical protein